MLSAWGASTTAGAKRKFTQGSKNLIVVYLEIGHNCDIGASETDDRPFPPWARTGPRRIPSFLSLFVPLDKCIRPLAVLDPSFSNSY